MKKLLLSTALCTAVSAQAAVTVKHYGFVKAAYTMSDKTDGAASGTEVAHKPFFAQDSDASTDYEKAPKSYITTTQSRWGMLADGGSKTSARFEFDLDNGQTNGADSLTTARIRQANIIYKPTENDVIEFGKKWSVFMGVLPHTKGFTRVYFWAGNSGFFTNGVDWTHSFGNTDLILDLSNTDNGDTSKERSGYVDSPVASIVLNHKMGDHKFGIAHTTAELKQKELNSTYKNSKASGTKVYWAGKFDSLSVAAEYSMGSNLGSIQTGDLGKATTTTDDEVKTSAYFLSLKYAADGWAVYGGHGMNAMNDIEDAGDGKVAKNQLSTLGFDYTLDEGLTFFVEHNMFTTSFYRSADDETEDYQGGFTELGMVYVF